MLGVPDPLYVAARHVARCDRGAERPPGSRRTRRGPGGVAAKPLLEDFLGGAGFRRSPNDVGAWTKEVSVEGLPRSMVVDFLVPSSLGGPGRRGARIPPHDRRTARKVLGLEGVLVDRNVHRITSLEASDTRELDVSVAGPAGLLVAKIFKIGERAGDADRRSDKDALDVFRLLQAVSTDEFARRMRALRAEEESRAVTEQALAQFHLLFGSPRAIGSTIAARAAAPLEAEDTIAAATAALARDLIVAIRIGGHVDSEWKGPLMTAS